MPRRGVASLLKPLAWPPVAPFSGWHFPLPVSAEDSQRVPDPILAAIETHKAAMSAVVAVLDTHTILEKELPKEKRRSFVTIWEEKIVETDDPRWIECEREIIRAWDAEMDAAVTLVTVRPTTQAGLLALLQHALMHDTDGCAWPAELVSDDGKRRTWHYFLIENVATALALGVA